MNRNVVVVADYGRNRIRVGTNSDDVNLFVLDVESFYEAFGTEEAARMMYDFLTSAFGLGLSDKILKGDMHKQCANLATIYENCMKNLENSQDIWIRT